MECMKRWKFLRSSLWDLGRASVWSQFEKLLRLGVLFLQKRTEVIQTCWANGKFSEALNGQIQQSGPLKGRNTRPSCPLSSRRELRASQRPLLAWSWRAHPAGLRWSVMDNTRPSALGQALVHVRICVYRQLLCLCDARACMCAHARLPPPPSDPPAQCGKENQFPR